METDLRKTVVITGGATGIGRACAETLAAEGYRVAIIYRSSAREAEELAARLNDGSELRAIAVQADVSDGSSVKRAFERIIEVFGRVDALVNNAGVAQSKLLIDMTDEEISRIVDVDYKGAVYCAREAVRHMLSAGGGAIVNIASVWGVIGAAMETVYSGAKAALIGFTKALSSELGYSGIRVNAVSPGVIDTRMNKAYSAVEIDDIVRDIPLGRMGEAREVAECVGYLLRAEYVTGANIEINGGYRG